MQKEKEQLFRNKMRKKKCIKVLSLRNILYIELIGFADRLEIW